MVEVHADPFLISDLRARPEFCCTVADRIWNAWWRDEGCALDDILLRVKENFVSETIPFALVAHADDRFLGTASVIASDMEERPHYTPWVAAVWVEADHRNRGIGAALVRAAADAAFRRGVESIYLCSLESKAGFYMNLGWRRIEQDVGGLDIFTLSRGQMSD